MEYKSVSAFDLWNAALGELQVQVSKSNYKTWLEKTVGLDFEDGRFIVGVPNTFVAEYLEKNQLSLIEKTLIGIMHLNVEAVFKVNGIVSHKKSDSLAIAESPALNNNFTFDSFVVGTNNQLAYSAAMEIAEHPGRSYNPLVICGSSGLGKTHLLQAIGHRALKNEVHVLYASGEQYTNEFVAALMEKHTDDFRNKYRNTEMLLIDDVNFVTGKKKTEESLLHTISELQNSSRQIALTCDRPPQVLQQMSEKLRSRLRGGLVADIQSPDFDTRLHILEAKAKSKGVNVNLDTLEFIAQSIRQNIRELEGSLNRVVAYARLIQNTITPELAVQALENISEKSHSPTRVTPQLLVEAVADSFQLSIVDLRSKKRDKETALARQMAMYVMKQEMNCSLTQIGRELGGRNPATVTYACQKIASEIAADSFLQTKLADIQQRIENISHTNS